MFSLSWDIYSNTMSHPQLRGHSQRGMGRQLQPCLNSWLELLLLFSHKHTESSFPPHWHLALPPSPLLTAMSPLPLTFTGPRVMMWIFPKELFLAVHRRSRIRNGVATLEINFLVFYNNKNGQCVSSVFLLASVQGRHS